MLTKLSISVVSPWVTRPYVSCLVDMFKFICVSTKLTLIKSFVSFLKYKWSFKCICIYDCVQSCVIYLHTHSHTQMSTLFAFAVSANPANLSKKQSALAGINWSTQPTVFLCIVQVETNLLFPCILFSKNCI